MCDDLAILYVNMVNFGLEFIIAKFVQPLVSFFKRNLSDKLSHDPLDRFSPNFNCK